VKSASPATAELAKNSAIETAVNVVFRVMLDTFRGSLKKEKIYFSLMSLATIEINLSRKRRSFSKPTACPFYLVKLSCRFGFGNLKQIDFLQLARLDNLPASFGVLPTQDLIFTGVSF
jgi:hypothetical protein